jgi:diguanylate cyclase (GGDEF)-like protein
MTLPGEPGAMHDLLDRATAAAGIGAWQCDLATEALTWSTGTYALFGIPLERTLDRGQIVQMYEPESRAAMERLRAEALAWGSQFTVEAKIVRPDGTDRWIRIKGDVVCRNGQPVQLYGVKQDVTEERRHREALRRLAEQDPVTGLASRAMFQSKFLSRSRGSAVLAPLGALILFDLDGFKALNDRYGHAAGDACLREVAVRLLAGIRDVLMIARIGGDEFAVLTLPWASSDAVRPRVQQIIEEICHPFFWQGHVLRIGASAGVVLPQNEWLYDSEELFAAADAALYCAKRQGRNRVIIANGGGPFAMTSDQAGHPART